MRNTLARVRNRLVSIWERLSGSLWLVPGFVLLLMMVLSFGLIEASRVLDPLALDRWPRFFGSTPESARSVLSTIAGSVITVAGVTFSIMVVAVAQASSQYTPRVLRNFMRDRPTQVTLGVLVGVFVYCLIVLRTVRNDGEDGIVPEMAVLGALLLALVAVVFLMYFIHHIASTLEAGRILASVAAETRATAARMYPEPSREESDEDCAPGAAEQCGERWHAVAASQSGYIQHFDTEGLLQWSRKKDCVVRMELAVGEFAIQGLPLVSLAHLQPDAEGCDELNQLFVLETYRTVYQDAGFGIRQMVDIALKALSPGVNDVTTAIAAIHHLTAVLVQIAARHIPSNLHVDGGRVRVIARTPSFEVLLDEAFVEIRRSGAQNPRVLVEVAKALQLIGQATHNRSRRRALLEHLDLVRYVAASASVIPQDRAPVLSLCEQVRAALQENPSRSRHVTEQT